MAQEISTDRRLIGVGVPSCLRLTRPQRAFSFGSQAPPGLQVKNMTMTREGNLLMDWLLNLIRWNALYEERGLNGEKCKDQANGSVFGAGRSAPHQSPTTIPVSQQHGKHALELLQSRRQDGPRGGGGGVLQTLSEALVHLGSIFPHPSLMTSRGRVPLSSSKGSGAWSLVQLSRSLGHTHPHPPSTHAHVA